MVYILDVVRAASMVIILINAFILYRSGESIVVALAGEQQGAIFWVLQFTANIFLPIPQTFSCQFCATE